MIIELLNGKKLDIADYSLKRLFHHIPSVSLSHNTEQVDGRDGLLFLETTFDSRVISVELLYESYDIYDYYLLRDEINALFTRKESFYIIFKNEPYKRYLVRLNQAFEVEPNQYMNSFTVEFTCVNVFAESIATTKSSKEWDVDVWSWNGAITWDDDLNYSFKNNAFTVKNLGNVDIDPRQSELEIILKGTFSSSVVIKNETTGDVYVYNGSLNANDVLVLKGVQSYKNGTSVFKNTNKKLIRLFAGENNFTITGGNVSSVDFNFRFLYL
ncbi:distal tail protein Dit [Lysinibacillus agricola]|uniref:distal tail protein Dit n=1 Tax=Lysinibacillus agricola TaxID=2590012 RepID=UPI003C1D51F5